MNIKDLREIREFAKNYGCKAIIYGGTGSGKTPISNTCPRPLMLACEPGLLSMRNSTIPGYYADTPQKIDEFFTWLKNSGETKNFDTVIIDSISFMADIYLQAEINGTSASGKKVHGLAAYGNMATNVMNHLRPLYFLQQKHTYLIAKEQIIAEQKRIYFPGEVLNKEVPGLYDFILHLGIKNVPQMGLVKAFQCNETYDVLSRNRTGNLNDYEPPDFAQLVTKAMKD